jgi:tight adherence protein B
MVSFVCCVIAVLVWPVAPTTRRLRDLTTRRRSRRVRPPRPGFLTLVATATAAGWLIAGPGGAVAGLLAAGTAWRRWRARGELNRSLSAISGLAEATHALVAGLRAGAHPAEAAESAAIDAQPAAAASMRALAAAARLDGDVRIALAAAGPETVASGLARISRAWTLAQRHGLPLADILDAVGRDLEQRARFARQVLARMSGPRTSAAVLALLPALGIALGEAIGAQPLRMLTGPGQPILAVGVALLCAGVAWCGRLTGQVVPR